MTASVIMRAQCIIIVIIVAWHRRRKSGRIRPGKMRYTVPLTAGITDDDGAQDGLLRARLRHVIIIIYPVHGGETITVVNAEVGAKTFPVAIHFCGGGGGEEHEQVNNTKLEFVGTIIIMLIIITIIKMTVMTKIMIRESNQHP